jgi:thymidine kinase
MAKLYFRYACMSAAKSAELIMKAYSLEKRGLGVVCIKPSIDTRDGDGVIKSRIGLERGCYTFGPEDDIALFITGLIAEGKQIDWVMADEAQFFSKKQIDQLSDIVDYCDINVVCYGLRTDFKTNLFEGSRRLFEIADTIEEIKQVCSCGNKTIVNARIDADGNFVTDGEQVEIAGDSKYISVCRKCFKEGKKTI